MGKAIDVTPEKKPAMIEPKKNSQGIGSLFLKNLKKDKLALFGAILLVCFIMIGIFSDSIAPHEPRLRHYNEEGQIRRLEPPSAAHWLGTTDVGRDIYSQVILGTRTALTVGILAALLVTFVGATVGIIAGYFGGIVDAILMRIVDFFYAIPFIPFVIVLAAVLKPSMWNVILAVSMLSWRTVARLVRSQVLSIAKRPFIKAAKVTGAGHTRIMFKYILPNVIPLILLEMAFMVNFAIMAEASIAFLGFGDPNKASWGQILHINFLTGNSRNAWWWTAPPGIAIVLLLVSIFFVARALEEIVDPRLRRR
ncbi:binding-protein-dependent transport systems inner membrane component [Alkaliphilus metalliredigens QYMF]|uniref:Binding-protein-dependent transport systems inner membrane component n=1 Tax=Alkaliphilus metalliredigens (strain QYMF) TaxID=293826 RepID=A6TTD9_ALKMQ|nr:ABC transporter permease [Alkaliphilus metalliredigens]ABR49457.1 binding-protein-dependent transport systems inner membrane component [Alkaliphilus metalliredigens QYMF]